jgi:serine/threonine-protein kinase
VKVCPKCDIQHPDTVTHCASDGAALHYAPGTVLARKYEILSVLGSGGMGVVYRARHTLLNQERALKFLLTAGPGARQRVQGLIDEVRVMLLLDHPHIVRVYDVEYVDDVHPVAVMEYVPGQDLSKRLKSSGNLPPDLALRFASEACSALAAAHSKGIFHRDIKPQNLLLATDAQGREFVKVIDFGIAKIREDADPDATSAMTRTTGMIVGTPHYASPEQAMGMSSDRLDGRTDIYSLGAVLYEMLTGRLPFEGGTAQSLLYQRAHTDPQPVDRVRPDLNFPPALSALVGKALAKDRDVRFRDAAEMQQAIAAVASDPGKTARSPKPPGTKHSRSLLIPGALVVALVGIGGLLVQRYRPTPEPPRQDPAPVKVIPAPAATDQDVEPASPKSTEIPKRPPTPPKLTENVERPPAPPAKIFRNPKDELNYVLIPAATDIDAFRIGETPVTQKAFERVMHANPSHFTGDEQLPVESVTWDEATAYCQAIGGQLPTEEQYEHAARGGIDGGIYGSVNAVAWHLGNSDRKTHRVAQKEPNSYGLYDMLGNVWELTTNWYNENQTAKAIRGGSWNVTAPTIGFYSRSFLMPGDRRSGVGFRCIAKSTSDPAKQP